MKRFFLLGLLVTMICSCGNSKEAIGDNTSEPNETELILENSKTEETKTVINPESQEVKSNNSTKNMNTAPSQNYEIILQEAYGGLDTSEERVIRSAKGLQEIYGIINRFRRPGIPVPEIDFNNYMVIALFMGEKPTGGHSTEIQSIDESSTEKITVNILEKTPSPDAGVSAAICQPFCFVKVPLSKKEVLFKKV